MNDSIPTPLTDAAPSLIQSNHPVVCDLISADFARTLERRLVVAERKLEVAVKAIQTAIDYGADAILGRKLREALAAIERIGLKKK